MADYLLDTNHASPLVTLHHPLRHRVLAAIRAGDAFAITVPVLTETLYGISIAPRGPQNLAIWATAGATARVPRPGRRGCSSGG